MCCRYLFDDSTLEEVWKVVNDVDQKIHWQAGDIHPSDHALVLTGHPNNREKNGLRAQEMKWGLDLSYSSQLIINARSETVLAKASFSQAVSKSRCLIPARQFYEWDSDKNKVTFSLEKENTMYMAGFYLPYHDIDRFTILTTAANDSMKPVHDRMPLILAADQIQDWIFDNEKVAWYLSQPSPHLHRFQEFQQLSFFDLFHQ
ncbi:MAG: SOS response-associated peptidase family protein [Eubacteriales bacterium]|nr:SOS response-associated peptidase family protein [Eubacteriales bacterium]